MVEYAADGLLARYMAGTAHCTIDPETLTLQVEDRLTAPGGFCSPPVTGVYRWPALHDDEVMERARLIIGALLVEGQDPEERAVIEMMGLKTAKDLAEVIAFNKEAKAREEPTPRRFPRVRLTVGHAVGEAASRVERLGYRAACAANDWGERR